MNEKFHPGQPPRRGFLKQVATATAVTTLPLAATAQTAPAAPAAAAPAVNDVYGYMCLSADEAAFVETMVNIMCPADAYTPNGVDCGLAVYIDRQLAGAYGKGDKRYARGPWMPGRPQQGWQLPLTPEQFFKAAVAAANKACVARHGKTFDMISAADGNTFLLDLGDGKVTDPDVPLQTWFDEMVMRLFNEACFADPEYGGNFGKVFWKLIGYPGLPATNTLNMVQYRGKPFPGAKNPKSIADFS